MYLHDRMEGSDGEMHAMCGVIPGEVRNTGKLTRFGYAEFSPLKSDGVTRGEISVKGHEFHYWDSDNCGSDWRAVKANGREYDCMHDTGRMLAGYPHLYYYSNTPAGCWPGTPTCTTTPTRSSPPGSWRGAWSTGTGEACAYRSTSRTADVIRNCSLTSVWTLELSLLIYDMLSKADAISS